MSIKDEFTVVHDEDYTPKRLVGHGIDIPLNKYQLGQLYSEAQTILAAIAITEMNRKGSVSREEVFGRAPLTVVEKEA